MLRIQFPLTQPLTPMLSGRAECVGLERPPSASAQWTCPRCQGGGGHGIYRGPPIARLVHQSPATIRRRTPSNVFSLLFTDNGLPDGEAVSYRIRGEVSKPAMLLAFPWRRELVRILIALESRPLAVDRRTRFNL